MRRLFPDHAWVDRAGNVAAGDVYPDQQAPVLTREDSAHVLRKARWGLPSPKKFHSTSGIDRGVTNVRNAGSPHWRRWLGPEHRCLAPFDRFAEPRGKGQGNAWFELSEPAFFAGILVEGWTSVRKLKDGESTDDLYGFLTTEPNGVVAPVHPKAMPVILIDPADWKTWLEADWSTAQALQRPLDGDAVRLMDPDGE